MDHGLDTAFIRKFKATLRQASEELGQLTQKYEIGLTFAASLTSRRGARIQIAAITAALAV